MFEVLDATCPTCCRRQARYLMGVGKPADMVGAVLRGVDMFDCVMPTRSGRTAQAFVSTRRAQPPQRPPRGGHLPARPRLRCPACANYSRAYLHHLFKAEEMLGPMLLTWHNIWHYQQLMQGLRDAISEGRVEAFARDRLSRMDQAAA
jgi:queuine tRNA-ribosyltransferase